MMMIKRPRHPMPEWVLRPLIDRGLMQAYKDRPPYQQNDYIGWIVRAKLKETREKRLSIMLEELARGDRYMKMIWHPRRVKKQRVRR